MRFWNLYFGILNNKYILHIFIELKKNAEKVNSNVIFHNIHLKMKGYCPFIWSVILRKRSNF